MDFSQKTVIVTGAGNGIGKGIAALYAGKGANVVLAELDEEAGRQAIEMIKAQGGEAVFVKTDVRKEADLLHLMKTAVTTYGQIDVLINNAGKGVFKSLFEITLDEWEDVIHTNLRSVFLASREAAKYMRMNKDGGAIINIASTRAIMSEANSESYAASKGGIVALTHALAASLSEERITVNAISPGWIETKNYANLTKTDHEQH